MKLVTGLLVSLVAAGAIASQRLELPLTPDSNSVQAVMKKALWEQLKKERELGYSSGALSGDYSQVVLKDGNSEVVCNEVSPSGGATTIQIQQFSCTIESK